MKHFLEISQLSQTLASDLMTRAIYFKKSNKFPQYPKNILANLFYENSTRTRVSFELAAKNLGIKAINLDLQFSSERKGEVVEDTIQNLAAMGVNIFVIRHKQSGFSQAMAGILKNNEHIINGGDGTHSHPSQAMLDFMTIMEAKPDLHNLKIAIVGDILHSRVANSLQSMCSLMRVGELVLVCPEQWQPKPVQYGRITTSLEDGITDADVVIALRVQRERLSDDTAINIQQYIESYSITTEKLKQAKRDVMIMHPGPINRGVEIDSDVADGPSSFILKQVKNGVFMRMAIIEALIAAKN
ncbi:MAG: aspartate carbamoyltransferase [Legionellales bacterium RIFCSPHIGHO2_12_FULL_35_11]|nr:MAG: aspartate carbamoyltransferase [Legionellales bacterium RIFCSPHIGHO2_12_FULL_35_11]